MYWITELLEALSNRLKCPLVELGTIRFSDSFSFNYRNVSKPFGRRPNDYLSLQSTCELINAVTRKNGIAQNQAVETIRVRNVVLTSTENFLNELGAVRKSHRSEIIKSENGVGALSTMRKCIATDLM